MARLDPSPRIAWPPFVLFLACLWTALLAAAPARAELIHPEVARRLDELDSAKGPEAYARLRDLWHAWEVADPTQVEEALMAFAADGDTAPELRAYAGLLVAYARRRRGDLEGATHRIAELGFVDRWLVVGPFDNDNKAGLAEAYVPELELDQPIVFDRSMTGKERAVRWRRSPDVHRWGFVDLGAMLRPQQDICAYVTTYVRGKPRTLSLWSGATGAFKLYWGTELVLEDAAYRQLDSDRRAVRVELREGYHRITAKVCGDESAPAFALRIAEENGAIAKGLELSVSDEASTDAASRLRTRPPDRAASPARPLGPLDRFEAAVPKTRLDAADAATLESYARYLTMTGGDPEGEHLARDLASRAADKQPTVARLLLAASLAEDRNGRRAFVERAAAIAKTPAERADVLLAQARLERTGPNWRAAFPLYDRLLGLEPKSAAAVLGKVDVYVQAGLKRTALAALERAVAEQPGSVALLRGLAGQLRALGRDTEASEVEARYAARRFDDGGYLAEQIELAVARRDRAGAKRWSERLLTSEPASSWAHGVVAKAQEALGDREGAIRTYRRALEIAPEDVTTIRALADLHGFAGRQNEQLALLQRILRILPQAKDVRAYVEHIQPTAARDDERYAWEPERFLDARAVTDRTHPRRTLRKLTVTTVFENGLASRFEQVVFQPLSDDAAARSRQYAFVYHADRQVVQLRAARVFRRDGRVDEAIESGTAPLNDPSMNMYTLQRTYYVQFPRLEPGDVVELRYRIDDVALRNEMSDYFGEIEYLQSDEPVGSAEYVLIAPKDKPLVVAVGPRRPKDLVHETKTDGKNRIHRFELDNVAPILAEPRMPPYGELLTHVHASTFTSWQDVGAWYWRLARDKLAADDSVRALAKKLTEGLTDERDKVAAIYHHAASETRYVALELGIEGIRPRSAALTLARGWGDCKDKATLIVSMLGVLGIEAELVLVRTGLRGGFDPTVPSIAPFDHAIAYIPSLDLYLDGTAEATGTAELPAMDRSSMALRITGGKGQLVKLPEPEPKLSRESHRIELALSASGDLDVRGRLEVQGVDAPGWRKRYAADSTRRERLASDLAGALGPIELLAGARGLTVSDLDALEKPVVLEIGGRASAPRDGDNLTIPMGPSWSLVSRYASKSSRKHDLLVGPRRERHDVWVLKLPPGKKVISMPQSQKIESPFGTHEIKVTHEGPRIEVESRLVLDKARIRRAEYPAWRSFCERVDAARARVLVSR